MEGVEERQEVVKVEPLLDGCQVELILSGFEMNIGQDYSYCAKYETKIC